MTNIFGLSVGITCCMLIFLYGKDEISFDRFHKNKDNIYQITADLVGTGGKVDRLSVSGMMPGPGFKKNIPEITDFTRIQYVGFIVKQKNEVIEEEAIYADENFFSVFSFPLLYGTPQTALTQLHSIVLSEKFATKYFGRTDILGKTLDLKIGSKFEAFVVTGVAKDSPQNSSIKLQMVLPMKYAQTLDDDKHWMNFFLNTFVVLKPGTDAKALETRMANVYEKEAAVEIKEMVEKYDSKDKTVYHLQPLANMHLSTDYAIGNGLTGGSNPMYSYILFAIAGFILLVACINFINLTISRSLKRAKEIGIRKVVGGARKQLIIQFLGESFILSFFAFIFACVLVFIALPFFNKLSDKELAFSYLFDTRLIMGYASLFLLTGLLAGFYPALVLSAFKPVETLYGKFRFTGKNYLSKGLVVFQFALSTFLIIATLTIYSQFNYLVNYDLGYDDKNVVMVATPCQTTKEVNVFKTELFKSPAFTKISTTQGGTNYTNAHINGETQIDFNIMHVDPDFFSLFNISILQGRNFSTELASDSASSVIINESFAKTAGWRDPLNKEVDFFYKKRTYNVIGVIKDYHFADLSQKISPQLFVFDPSYDYGRMYLRINPLNRVTALNHLQQTFKRLYPTKPYRYTFADENNLESYTKEAKWKQIIAFSAILTIFISCMGLFGLAALSAKKRAKEVGIRKVLGASVISIINKLSIDFIGLVTIATLIALPFSWWAMNKWLENYPYRIELKISVFVVSLTCVLLITLFTVSFQAFKAAITNPTNSLRTE